MNYKEKKAKGLVSLLKINGAYELTEKRYSVYDGCEVDPEIISVDLENLNRAKAELERQVADHDELINDVLKLK